MSAVDKLQRRVGRHDLLKLFEDAGDSFGDSLQTERSWLGFDPKDPVRRAGYNLEELERAYAEEGRALSPSK